MSVLPASLLPPLRDSWQFFLHLAVVLVPLFVGGSFLVGLAQEYLPPEAVERRLLAVYAGTVVAIGATLGVLFNAVLV